MEDNRDFEREIKEINRRIWLFNVLAWISVASGLVVLFVGIDIHFNDEGKFNEVGDFVGGVAGSLWALAGLFFIYIAFLGQKIEIKYQQEDLKLTRDELKETKDVFKQQSRIMNNQQLDNTFFNLLDNHRKLVEGFKLEDFSNKHHGYEAIDEYYSISSKYFDQHSKFLISGNVGYYDYSNKSPKEKIESYSDLTTLYNEVTNILDFINERIEIKLKSFYFKTLSTNLTSNEKFLIQAYNYLAFEENLIFDFESFKHENFYNLKTKINKLNLELKTHETELPEGSRIKYPKINYDISRIKVKEVIVAKTNKVLFSIQLNQKNEGELDIVRDSSIPFEELLNQIFEQEPSKPTNSLVIKFEMDDLIYIERYSLYKSGGKSVYRIG